MTNLERFIRKNDAGLWECNICGFTAMSKKVIKQHIKNAHPEVLRKEEQKHDKEKKNKERKDKRVQKAWNSIEFELLINKTVVVVLKNGSIVEGKLTRESAYNIILENATIRGLKHIAKVEYLIINKTNVALIHTPPTSLEPVSESE